LNKTGLDGVYEINVDIRPELGGDIFTLWQRILQISSAETGESANARRDFGGRSRGENPDRELKA